MAQRLRLRIAAELGVDPETLTLDDPAVIAEIRQRLVAWCSAKGWTIEMATANGTRNVRIMNGSDVVVLAAALVGSIGELAGQLLMEARDYDDADLDDPWSIPVDEAPPAPPAPDWQAL